MYRETGVWASLFAGDAVQSQGCDTVGLRETWWDNSWAVRDGYRLCRSMGRSGLALYVRKCLDCVELGNGDLSG